MTSIITLCLIVVTFVAISAVILKAGYSRVWILVPLTPLATWIATLVEAKIQLHTFVILWELAPFYPHTIGLLLDIDKIAIAASWLFLLVFAFTRWPVNAVSPPVEASTVKSRVRGPVRGAAGAAPNAAPATPAHAAPAHAGRYPLPKGPGFGTLGFVAGPGAAAHESSSTVATKPRGNQLATYCARCGESIPGNRALAHSCPNLGQPATFCRYCGKSIPEGADVCPSCDQEA